MHEEELNISDSHLSQFSNLQRLSLSWLSSNGVLYLSEAISALTHLTDLILTVDSTNLEHLLQLQRKLPGSLRHIYLRAYPRFASSVYEQVPLQLQLQQLQGLQALDVTEVLQGSVLPSQLNRLSCSDCRSMQTLQLCTQLQQLRIANCTATADEWRKLSDLRALTNIEATIPTAAADTAAPGFRLRPLRSALLVLKIYVEGEDRITEATLQNLKWLTALTELTIPVLADAPLPGSPEELGVVLQQLTALQRLELYADQDVSLFAPVVPALPADIQEEIRYLMMVNANEFLVPLSQLALQAAPNLNQAVTAGHAGFMSLYFAISSDPAAVEQLHQYVQQMHVHQQQIPESGEHQDLQLLVEGIAVLPRLNSLKLKGCGLHMDAVQPLTRMSQLTRLTISGEVSLLVI